MSSFLLVQMDVQDGGMFNGKQCCILV